VNGKSAAVDLKTEIGALYYCKDTGFKFVIQLVPDVNAANHMANLGEFDSS